MSVALVTLIAVLVGVLVVVLVGSIVVFLVVVKRKAAETRARLSEELASVETLRGPENAVYRGGTGDYPKVKGNGMIALTSDRLLFRKLLGADVDVPLADVTGARITKGFNGSVTGGQVHLVVQTPTGEVGYFVSATEEWRDAVLAAAGR